MAHAAPGISVVPQKLIGEPKAFVLPLPPGYVPVEYANGAVSVAPSLMPAVAEPVFCTTKMASSAVPAVPKSKLPCGPQFMHALRWTMAAVVGSPVKLKPALAVVAPCRFSVNEPICCDVPDAV